MTANEVISSWEKIQQGVKEAETLMGKREYNLSMVKARQTLEFMVHCLCDQAGIMEPDLSRSIDALYNERVITKTTCEHYHKIRMLGNSAVHENNTSAYDANQAYQFLSQEVYTFSHDYRAGKRRPSATSKSRSSQTERRTSGSSRGSSSSRSRKKSSDSRFSSTDLIRLGAVLVCVAVIVLVVRLVLPKKKGATETAPVTTENLLPETTAAPETMAETTPATVYKTSDNLNVRSEPSTSGNKLGLLPAGTIVDYVGDYDSEWAVINYDGTQAYVSKQFLVHD